MENAKLFKGGFWSSVKRAIRTVVVGLISSSALDVNGFFSSWVDAQFADWGWRVASIELNEFEQDEVDGWVEYTFKPFFIKLCEKLDYKPSTNFRASETTFITTVNEVREIMAVVLSYNSNISFSSHNIFAGTDSGERIFNAQLDIVNMHFDGIEAYIEQKLSENNIIAPTILTSVEANKYINILDSYPLDWKGEQVHTSYNRIEDSRSTGTTTGTGGAEISPPPPTNTETTTTATPTTATTPKKSNMVLKLAAILGISYVVGKAVSKKSK